MEALQNFDIFLDCNISLPVLSLCFGKHCLLTTTDVYKEPYPFVELLLEGFQRSNVLLAEKNLQGNKASFEFITIIVAIMMISSQTFFLT